MFVTAQRHAAVHPWTTHQHPPPWAPIGQDPNLWLALPHLPTFPPSHHFFFPCVTICQNLNRNAQYPFFEETLARLDSPIGASQNPACTTMTATMFRYETPVGRDRGLRPLVDSQISVEGEMPLTTTTELHMPTAPAQLAFGAVQVINDSSLLPDQEPIALR
jgi:hypothetical protein